MAGGISNTNSSTSNSVGGDRHEILTLRLEVGHESELLAQPRITYPCAHTHRWTVFVRGQNEANLEPYIIQKVIFNLHEDFPNPKRVVTAAPFQVSETGYGGFMIPIYILFAHTKKEKYLEYDMNLKYAPFDKNKETRLIEFRDPRPELRAKLLKAGAEILTIKSAGTTTTTTSTSSSSAKIQGNGSGAGAGSGSGSGSGGGGSFQDLFGETLRVASPAIPNAAVEKPNKAATPSTSLTADKRQPTCDSPSPSGAGGDKSTTTTKHLSSSSSAPSAGKQQRGAAADKSPLPPTINPSSSSLSSSISSKKHLQHQQNHDNKSTAAKDAQGRSRAIKDYSSSNNSNSKKKSTARRGSVQSGGNNIDRNIIGGEEDEAGRCLADASKLLVPPPFVSPLSECSHHDPQASGSGLAVDLHHQPATSKSSTSSKSSKSKSSSSIINNNNRQFNDQQQQDNEHVEKRPLENGKITTTIRRKRKKNKSDSGLESDYSNYNTTAAANSSDLANGNNLTNGNNNNNSLLFSPPDSVRSLDTLQESPASTSAVSSCSNNSTIAAVTKINNNNNEIQQQHQQNDRENNNDLDHLGGGGADREVDEEERLRMLLVLQQKIMTIRDKRTAQLVADLISSARDSEFAVTDDCLQFDLCTLDSPIIQRLIRLLDDSPSTSSYSSSENNR